MNDETNGRLLALEALVIGLLRTLPRAQAEALLAEATPSLQRHRAEVAGPATRLIQQAWQQLPPA